MVWTKDGKSAFQLPRRSPGLFLLPEPLLHFGRSVHQSGISARLFVYPGRGEASPSPERLKKPPVCAETGIGLIHS